MNSQQARTETELSRADAVGARAKRRAFVEAHREQELGKRKIEDWSRELHHWKTEVPDASTTQSRIDDGIKHAKMKIEHWGSRLRAAEQRIEELRPLILRAWG